MVETGYENATLARRIGALSYEAIIVAALVLVVGFLTVPLVLLLYSYLFYFCTLLGVATRSTIAA